MAVMTKTPQGDDIVILARTEYDALLAAANEDGQDVITARRALERIEAGTETILTAEEVDELLAAKTPLAFYRKRAGLSQTKLAAKVGIAQGFLSEIENGSKTGDVQTLRKVASALGTTLDDLVGPEKEPQLPRTAPKKRGQVDRSKINMHEGKEVRYWTHQLGVSRDQLQAAVDKVGNAATAVRKAVAR